MTIQIGCQIYLVWMLCCLIYGYKTADDGEKPEGLFIGFLYSIAIPILLVAGVGILAALAAVVMIALGIN